MSSYAISGYLGEVGEVEGLMEGQQEEPVYFTILKASEGSKVAYYVVRVDSPDEYIMMLERHRSQELRGYYATRLTHFIRLRCVGGELEQLLGKVLSSGQFKELMSGYIRRCFRSDREVKERLERLENFVNMRLGRAWQYPAVVKCWGSSRFNSYGYLCWHSTSFVYLNTINFMDMRLYEDGFCFLREKHNGEVTCFSYNPEDVDAEALVKLARHKKPFYDAIKEAYHDVTRWLNNNYIDLYCGDEKELFKSQLEKVEKVLSHALFLLEMLEG